MELGFFLVLTLVLIVISISIWEAFHAVGATRWLMRLIDSSPILQLIFHFAIGSLVIVFLHSEALIAGAANLTATCLFPVWCWARLKWWPTTEMKYWKATKDNIHNLPFFQKLTAIFKSK